MIYGNVTWPLTATLVKMVMIMVMAPDVQGLVDGAQPDRVVHHRGCRLKEKEIYSAGNEDERVGEVATRMSRSIMDD